MTPAFAPLPKAAKFCGMRQDEFMRYVREGSLPGPVRFGKWDLEQLSAIMRGAAMLPKSEDLE